MRRYGTIQPLKGQHPVGGWNQPPSHSCLNEAAIFRNTCVQHNFLNLARKDDPAEVNTDYKQINAMAT